MNDRMTECINERMIMNETMFKDVNLPPPPIKGL